MRNSVVFPTDIYKVTASEAEESKSLTVYTTLTGECTMQETNKAPEEIRTNPAAGVSKIFASKT